MPSELGSFLRHLRLTRRLAQSQAALMAGIGRTTLNRWETGVQQPRVVEIEALLSTLQATQEERRRCATLHQTAAARAKARDIVARVGAQEGIGSLPQGGDLLRALRLRRDLSQGEIAQRVGVAERTVRRWEKSEIWPSSVQLAILCSELGAHAAEESALAAGHLPLGKGVKSDSLEALRQQGKELHAYREAGPQQSLKDLGFLTLESQVWPFAARSAGGREVLAQLYGYHASYLDSVRRFAESGIYAQRSLDLVSEASVWGIDSPSAIVLARSAIHRGACPNASRGIPVLRQWLDVPQEPAYHAWLISDLAKYIVQTRGSLEESLVLAQRAIAVAEDALNPIETPFRELDKAQILLWGGEARRALRFIEQENAEISSYLPVQARLLQVEAHLHLKNISTAHDHLQDALTLIEDMALPLFLPQAQNLALRF